MHRDLLALKVEGGWSSVTLVEGYAHLIPVGHEDEIRRFLGLASTGLWHVADTAIIG